MKDVILVFSCDQLWKVCLFWTGKEKISQTLWIGYKTVTVWYMCAKYSNLSKNIEQFDMIYKPLKHIILTNLVLPNLTWANCIKISDLELHFLFYRVPLHYCSHTVTVQSFFRPLLDGISTKDLKVKDQGT